MKFVNKIINRPGYERMLPKKILDLDENEESGKSKISLFHNLQPQILVVNNYEEESLIVSDWINQQIILGISSSEIVLFVKSVSELSRT